MVVRYGVEFELPDGRTQTVTAREEGHVPPAARVSPCEQGWDLACAVRVLHGELDQSDARRYYDEDDGAASPSSAPRRRALTGDCDTHQTAAMRRHRYAHGLPAPRGT